ncbi:hypothetical protein GMRT_11903 [Giardia muris]|uniref:Uncharacterized protein n=1 Tax=Giardia muris TaxID=5742 RepID=A0A4Z1SRL9_GIAMU|nr:hypothetical protein GMRT_11903 [Giardia muris]|eukprot:TNJ28516.1 hypothetical protein GMRT_11903 [Giardia muris]
MDTRNYALHLDNSEWLKMFKVFLAVNEKAEHAASQPSFLKPSMDPEFALVFDWLHAHDYNKTRLVLEVESFNVLDLKRFNFASLGLEPLGALSPGTSHLEQIVLYLQNPSSNSHRSSFLSTATALSAGDSNPHLLSQDPKGASTDLSNASRIQELEETLSRYKRKHNELMYEWKARLSSLKEELVQRGKLLDERDAEITRLRNQLLSSNGQVGLEQEELVQTIASLKRDNSKLAHEVERLQGEARAADLSSQNARDALAVEKQTSERIRLEFQAAEERLHQLEETLKRCATGEDAAQSNLAALTDALNSANSVKARLQEELADANATLSSYLEKLHEKDGQYLRLADEKGELATKLAALEAVRGRLEKEVAQLNQRLAGSQEQLSALQQRQLQDTSEMGLKDQQQRGTIKQLELRLQSSLENAHMLDAERQAQQKTITGLRQDLAKNQSELMQATSSLSELGARYAGLESQYKELHDQYTQAMKERKALADKKQAAEEQIARLTAAIETLKTEYSRAYECSADLGERNSTMAEELARLKSELAGANATNTQREETMAQLREKLDSKEQELQRLLEEKSALIATHTQLEAEYRAFRSNEVVTCAAETKQKLMETEVAFAALQQRYDRVDHELRTELGILTARNEEFTSTCEMLKEKNGKLMTELQAAIQDKIHAEANTLALQTAQDALATESTQLRERLDDATSTIQKQQDATAILQAESAKLQQELIEKATRIGELELQVIRLEGKDAEIASLASSIQIYKDTVASLNEKVSSLEIDAIQRQQLCQNLEQQLSIFSESRAEQTAAITKLQERNTNVSQALATLNQKYEALVEQHESLHNENKVLQSEGAARKDAESEARASLHLREQEIASLTAELTELKERHSLAAQEQAEEYLVIKHQYQRMLEDERQRASAELAQARAQIDVETAILKNRVEDLETQIQLERKRNDTLTESLMMVRASFSCENRISESKLALSPPQTPTSHTLSHESPMLATVAKVPRPRRASANQKPQMESPSIASSTSVQKVILRTEAIQCNTLSDEVVDELHEAREKCAELSSALSVVQLDYEEKCNALQRLEQQAATQAEDLAVKVMDLERGRAEIEQLRSAAFVSEALVAELRQQVSEAQEESNLLRVKLSDANITESNTVITLEKRIDDLQAQLTQVTRDRAKLAEESERAKEAAKRAKEDQITAVKAEEALTQAREADLRAIYDKVLLLYSAYKSEYNFDPIQRTSYAEFLTSNSMDAFTVAFFPDVDQAGIPALTDKQSDRYMRASGFNPFRSAGVNDDSTLTSVSKSQRHVTFSLTESQTREPVPGRILVDRTCIVRVLDSMVKKFDVIIQNVKEINGHLLREAKEAKQHSTEATSQHVTLSREYSALLDRCTTAEESVRTLELKLAQTAHKASEGEMLRSRYELLNTEYQKSIEIISEAQTKLTDAEHQIQRLQQSNQSLVDVVSDQKAQLQQFDDTKLQLEHRIQTQQQELVARNADLAAVQQQCKTQAEELARLEAGVLRMDGVESSMKQLLEERTASIESLRAQLQGLTVEKADLNARLLQQVEKGEQTAMGLTRVTHELSTVQLELSEAQAALKAKDVELESMVSARNLLQTRFNALQEENTELMSGKARLDGELLQANMRLEAAALRLSQLESEKTTLQSTFNALKDCNSESVRDQEALQQELRLLRAQLEERDTLRDELQKTHQLYTEAEDELKQASTEMQMIVIGKEKLQAELSRVEAHATALERENTSLQTELIEVREKFLAGEKVQAELESDRCILANKITVLTEEKQKAEDTIERLEEALAQKEGVTSDLVKSLNSSNRAVNPEVVSEVQQKYEEEIQRLTGEVQTLLEENLQLAEAAKGLQAELDATNRALAERDEQVAQFDLDAIRKKNEFEVALQVLRGDNERRYQQLLNEKMTLENQVSARDVELTVLQSEKQRLGERIRTLEDNVQRLSELASATAAPIPSMKLSTAESLLQFPAPRGDGGVYTQRNTQPVTLSSLQPLGQPSEISIHQVLESNTSSIADSAYGPPVTAQNVNTHTRAPIVSVETSLLPAQGSVLESITTETLPVSTPMAPVPIVDTEVMMIPELNDSAVDALVKQFLTDGE